MILRVLSFICVGLVLCAPSIVWGVDGGFVRLTGLPNSPETSQSTGQFVNALYRLSIGFGAFAAVVQIIIAGVQYMLSDIITEKSGALNRIRNSLIGLIILLSAVVILNTINPELTKLEFLRDAPTFKAGLKDYSTCPSGSRLVVRAMGDTGTCEPFASTVDIENAADKALVDAAIEAGDFTTVEDRLDIRDMSSGAAADKVKEFIKQCEENPDETWTGKIHVEIIDPATARTQHLCVRE